MDWYHGCENSDFVVPRDQEDLLERYPSPDSWSIWGIRAPEGFDSPENLIMDTNDETEVEFNFIDESFNNEIEFDPCLYDKDQSSSSSTVCGGLPEQSFQSTAFSCDHHQLQDLSTFEHTDDIFLYKRILYLKIFPVLKAYTNLSFMLKINAVTQLVITTFYGRVQKDIKASEFVLYNSDSKDCQDIEVVKVLDPCVQSNGDETMIEQLSLEEFTLKGFEMLIAQFPEKIRICFRDALYRLARNTKQHEVEDLDGGLNHAMPESDYNQTMRSEDNKSMESETNSVDRAVANLMFNKMEINILDLPTTLVNLKQEVFGSKDLQGKSSKTLDVAQKSHYPHPEKVLADDAEVPRFGVEDQEGATESYLAYADPSEKSFMLEFG